MSSSLPVPPRVTRAYLVRLRDARAELLPDLGSWPLELVLFGRTYVRLPVVDPDHERAWLYVDTEEAAQIARVVARLCGFGRSTPYGGE